MCVTKPQMLFRVFDLRPPPSAEGGGPSVKQERSSKGFSQQICEMPTCQAKKGRKGVQVGKFTSIPPSLFKAIVHQRRGIGDWRGCLWRRFLAMNLPLTVPT